MTLLDGSGTRLDAVAVELSGRGIRLAVDHPVQPGTPVRIETSEAFYLAEICYCTQLANQMWQVGLKVDQSLSGWSDLARLRHFLEPEMAAASHEQPVTR